MEAPGTAVAFVLVLTRATDAAGHSIHMIPDHRPSADLAFRTMSFAKIVIAPESPELAQLEICPTSDLGPQSTEMRMWVSSKLDLLVRALPRQIPASNKCLTQAFQFEPKSQNYMSDHEAHHPMKIDSPLATA